MRCEIDLTSITERSPGAEGNSLVLTLFSKFSVNFIDNTDIDKRSPNRKAYKLLDAEGNL